MTEVLCFPVHIFCWLSCWQSGVLASLASCTGEALSALPTSPPLRSRLLSTRIERLRLSSALPTRPAPPSAQLRYLMQPPARRYSNP